MKPSHPRTERRIDELDPARAAAFMVALGRDGTIARGDALPPFFHQLYFWDPYPREKLGRDGHPEVDGTGLIPDMGLPRRMWAGGRLAFGAPLIAGQSAERRSFIEKAEHKHGRSGPLGFVTLRHEIRQDDTLCLTEWQDLVYRQDAHPGQARPVPAIARSDESDRREESFDAVLLFRYSALTFNGHRIHYDRDYARQVEGYEGLVVHGPLLAQKLMLMAQDLIGPLAQFQYRAKSALIDNETATFCRKGTDLWIRGPDMREIMTASAVPRL